MATRKLVNAATAESKPRRKASANRPPPRKPKLGQNFLRDPHTAARIVDALGEISSRTVVEIGPGPGILTDILAERARHLIAVELDRVLTAQLRMKFTRKVNVEIIEANILDVSLAGLLRTRTQPLAGMAAQTPVTKVDVIGNLPYYITSDILLRLLDQHEGIDRIVIMVQKEVADRIAAKPGSRDYGLLSATAQLHAKVEKLFIVPPGAFQPPPQVHSAVLRLTIAPREEELGVDGGAFIDFLKLSFAQKRKTLLNNLKSTFRDDAIRAAFKTCGVRADARAEALGLEKLAGVFRQLQPHSVLRSG
ncbi:MAG TPA: 16S rRNA (adenine(1518)-N(6)/adenine(1519)-N(6))-dimethyltransferase RsmA [Terriglobales bacterium]|nr:16S rRNA (adenine(1518)-N(6)/adenine(1519)-N(6))-dimethyltransferase RsmA [Terriglobales bacterium]